VTVGEELPDQVRGTSLPPVAVAGRRRPQVVAVQQVVAGGEHRERYVRQPVDDALHPGRDVPGDEPAGRGSGTRDAEQVVTLLLGQAERSGERCEQLR
jgi:hypothetical protein